MLRHHWMFDPCNLPSFQVSVNVGDECIMKAEQVKITVGIHTQDDRTDHDRGQVHPDRHPSTFSQFAGSVHALLPTITDPRLGPRSS